MSQITISESAQHHFIKLLAQQPEGTNIRVFVVKPGSQNAECGVSYCPADAIESTDEKITFEGFIAYIDDVITHDLIPIKDREPDCFSCVTIQVSHKMKNRNE